MGSTITLIKLRTCLFKVFVSNPFFRATCTNDITTKYAVSSKIPHCVLERLVRLLHRLGMLSVLRFPRCVLERLVRLLHSLNIKVTWVPLESETGPPEDQSRKSYNAPILHTTMHGFVTEMCACVHISVTKWCIVGYLSDALWDFWDGSVGWCRQLWLQNRVWDSSPALNSV